MSRELPPFSSDQCRAARALLRWTAVRLAGTCDIDISTLRRFEAGTLALDADAGRRLNAVLHRAGVIPIDAHFGGEGARLKYPSNQTARAARAGLPAWLPLGDQAGEWSGDRG